MATARGTAVRVMDEQLVIGCRDYTRNRAKRVLCPAAGLHLTITGIS